MYGLMATILKTCYVFIKWWLNLIFRFRMNILSYIIYVNQTMVVAPYVNLNSELTLTLIERIWLSDCIWSIFGFMISQISWHTVY